MTDTLQIGDRVKRVGFDNQYVVIGTEGTVIAEPDENCVMVKWDGLAEKAGVEAAYNLPTFVEKIMPTQTFKVGDRVKTPYYGSGVITEINHIGECRVKHNAADDNLLDTEHGWYPARCLTVIPQPPQFIHQGQTGDTPESIAAEHASNNQSVLPATNAERKAIPLATGVLDYFPAALVEVAKVSKIGSDQHHPGQPLHWERGKSMDQADTLLRHFLERGTFDTDGTRHSAKVAWRALALLQIELEAEGAPVSRGSRECV
mgnify:CR=1 FL=1